jgi:hypothetical protein
MTNEKPTITGWGELEPIAHILEDFTNPWCWPALVIELRRAPGAPGFQETAFTPVDWQDEVPDVIVLDGCTLSVEERVATDGRTVHVFFAKGGPPADGQPG